ncbi:hypothetical protein ASPZODRAFT_128158 [Penicilliopsis zonata CBS 506.65]|uniref:Uncharacterized protein n=1 Tax=Penicilliopsis zonata CBS 506.65 TaxID=1073090 RepID=A0A1L9SRC1_9EURO|nr:hypothetical protein ASPZODRAFT_128158 [Penicilliopsis zonata CBS 506.65]OJJ49664.1 hypothetical protein ASPZODRAFT_128158 [Penicilliopsis zonata CBS 506.65]
MATFASITYFLLTILTLSSMVHSLPIVAGDNTRTRALYPRSPSPRLIEPNANGLLANIIANLGLDELSNSQDSTSDNKDISNFEIDETKKVTSKHHINDTVVDAGNFTSGKQTNITNVDNLVNDIKSSLAQSIKAALDDSDEVSLN